MSAFQAGYAFVTLLSLVLGIVFSLIDGMLLWAIAFFVLFLLYQAVLLYSLFLKI